MKDYISFPTGSDLSATIATTWKRLLPQFKRCAIGIGNTGTGSPIGQLSIEVCGHGNNAVSGFAPAPAVTVAATNGAGRQMLDNIVTGADYIRLVYTRTSGGAGAAWTDDSGVAGTVPSLIYKE